MRGPGGSDLTMLRVIAGAFNGTMRRCGRAIGLALVVPFTAPFGASRVEHTCSKVVNLSVQLLHFRFLQIPSPSGLVSDTIVFPPHLHLIIYASRSFCNIFLEESSIVHNCSNVVTLALHAVQVRCRHIPSASGRVVVTCVLPPHLHLIMTSPYGLAKHSGRRRSGRGLVSVMPRAGLRGCSML
jgi:hypothetical protein